MLAAPEAPPPHETPAEPPARGPEVEGSPQKPANLPFGLPLAPLVDETDRWSDVDSDDDDDPPPRAPRHTPAPAPAPVQAPVLVEEPMQQAPAAPIQTLSALLPTALPTADDATCALDDDAGPSQPSSTGDVRCSAVELCPPHETVVGHDPPVDADSEGLEGPSTPHSPTQQRVDPPEPVDRDETEESRVVAP
mmetsp:Transcript_9686/g.31921  ORF Transcript_9686/g.31921 Transcript_9686/m.31921 type:complete len:193 (+) Transcript_9686:494-1072(+)